MKKFCALLALLCVAAVAFAGPDFYLRGHDGVWFEVRDEYKFKQEGDVYTLHVDKLTSEYAFKIATADYSIQYGSKDAFGYDTPMLCVEGDGNDFSIADFAGAYVAGATLTLDRSNPEAVYLTVTPDLYLAGEMNNWNNCDPKTKFTFRDGVYTLALRELTGKFRIAAGIQPGWSVEYGASQGMVFGREYTCIPGPGNDMSMEQRFNNVIITFDKAAKTIRVSDNNANYAGVDFYLRGHDNNWEARDAYKFACHGDVYTLHVDYLWHSYGFKVANADYSLQFGSTETFAYDKTMKCVKGDGNNFHITGGESTSLAGATLIFDYGDPEAPTLKVVPDIYFAGGMNNWNNSLPDYRFNERHGIYSLYMESLSGDFKLTGGTNPEWTWEFGGERDMAVGNTYAVKSGGNNMSVSGAPLSNVTLVFDNDNKTLTLKPIEEVLEGRDLYLAGSFNGWNPADQRYKFERVGDHYTLRVPRIYGVFKVVTPDWVYQIGCRHSISLFRPASCLVASKGYEMELADGVQCDAVIDFYPSTMTIEISGRPALYLTGDFNDWSISSLYAFTYDDGKYVLDTHDFTGNFKIVTNDHVVQLGKANDDITSMYVSYGIGQVGHVGGELNFRGTGSGKADQRIRLTLDPDGESDVTDRVVETDSDAPTEYYNLQGMRVTHPANGIFIRRRGNVTEKIFVR